MSAVHEDSEDRRRWADYEAKHGPEVEAERQAEQQAGVARPRFTAEQAAQLVRLAQEIDRAADRMAHAGAGPDGPAAAAAYGAAWRAFRDYVEGREQS